MSTTSTTTTLAACDHTLGDDPELANCICVLIIARGDGTLFDANSLQEEDIVELCVGMGQAHPDDMLWLMGMESVMAFQSSKEILATAHLIILATVCCDYPVRLHTRPPTAAQIQDYIAMRDRCTPGAPAPTPQGDLIPPPLPSDRGTWPQFHLAIWDLDDAQLWEVLPEVCLETARREVIAPQVGLPVGLCEGPGGGANPGIIAGEVPLSEEKGWGPSRQGLLAPSSRGGHWTPHQYPSHQVVNQYPMN